MLAARRGRRHRVANWRSLDQVCEPMGAPELSVVIPAFGRQAELTRAVRSALAQDVDLDVVIVDDGSPEPLRADTERTSIVRLEANRGAAAARNAGVAAARGAWIAFLDSDDVWPAGSLRARVDAARDACDDACIWACAFTYVWPDGRREQRTPRPSAAARDFASGCWSCPGSTALMSKAAWARSGGQDETLRRLEDYEWLLRWGRSGGRLAVHPAPAAEIQRSGRAAPDVIATAAHAILRRHGDAPALLKSRMQSYLQLEMAAARLGHGDVIGGGVALARSWLLKPRLQAALEPFWTPARGG